MTLDYPNRDSFIKSQSKRKEFNVYFLPVRRQVKLSRQDIEIEQASARSHNARLYHRRRKERVREAALNKLDLPLLSSAPCQCISTTRYSEREPTSLHRNQAFHQHDRMLQPSTEGFRNKVFNTPSAARSIAQNEGLQTMDNDLEWPSIEQAVQGQVGQMVKQDFDRQLLNVLDPFLRIPIELTSTDRYLLHLSLFEATSAHWRATRVPVYQIAVHLASLVLQDSRIFVLSQLTVGEHILAQKTGGPLSCQFFTRKTQDYVILKTLLENPNSDAHETLIALNQLSVVSAFMQPPDRLAELAMVLWNFIQKRGGHACIMITETNSQVKATYTFYTSFLVSIEIPIDSKRQLRMILARFKKVLEQLETWKMQVETHSDTNIWGRDRAPRSSEALTYLRSFLDFLITNCVNPESQRHTEKVGCFEFVYTLCMTQVTYNLNIVEARKFLEETGNGLAAINPITGKKEYSASMDHLEPYSHIPSSMVGQVRAKLNLHQSEKEFALCQQSIDTQRLLPLLSTASRKRLVQLFKHYALCAVNENNVYRERFTKDCFHNLAVEAEDNWTRRQRNTEGKLGSQAGCP